METKKYRESSKMDRGFGSDVYQVSLLVSESDDEVLLKGRNGELFSCEKIKDFPHYKVVKANGDYYAYAEGKGKKEGRLLAEAIEEYHELSDGSIIVEIDWWQSRFGYDDACLVSYYHIFANGQERKLEEDEVAKILRNDKNLPSKTPEPNQPGGPQ